VLSRALNLKGELDCLCPLLFWKPGETHVTMNGNFTARALEAILTLVRSEDGSLPEEG